MSIRAYIGLAASILALIGAIFLFIPVDVTLQSGSTVECGSVIAPDKYAGFGADLSDAYTGGSGQTGGGARCDDALGGRTIWVLILLIGGVLVAGGAAVTRRRPPADQTAATTSGDTASTS